MGNTAKQTEMAATNARNVDTLVRAEKAKIVQEEEQKMKDVLKGMTGNTLAVERAKQQKELDKNVRRRVAEAEKRVQKKAEAAAGKAKSELDAAHKKQVEEIKAAKNKAQMSGAKLTAAEEAQLKAQINQEFAKKVPQCTGEKPKLR